MVYRPSLMTCVVCYVSSRWRPRRGHGYPDSSPQWRVKRRPSSRLPASGSSPNAAAAGLRPYWCTLYEKPIEEHRARFVGTMGLLPDIEEAQKTNDPIAALIAGLGGVDEDLDAAKLTSEESEAFQINAPIFPALATSLWNSLRCRMTFGEYINDLVARSRSGDDVA
jgi:hypothetical protein